MHLFFNEVYLLAFTRPIRGELSHNSVASIPTGDTPTGVYLESQHGYYFSVASFTLKTGRIGIPNTLIQPIS